MKYLYWFVIGVALLMGFKNPPPPKNCLNLTVSANKRFLTADGRPFFWLGDTAWLLLSKLNREETEKYLEDRKAKGFNVIQIMLLHSLSAVSVYGDSALIGKNVATPYLPRANPGANTQKNGYWENLDLVIDLAAKKGLYLAMVPVWGSNVKAGLLTEKQAGTYARFLAQRYKDKTNIIWMNGGDVRGDDSTIIWKTIGNTLKKYDPNHLVTFHPFGRTQSSEWFQNEPWLDFNMFQSGHRRYDQEPGGTGTNYGEDNWRYVLSDYSKMPVKPTLDGEPSYEGIPQGLHDTLQPRWTDNDVRRYAYWSVFSGACGFTYGNNSVMQMHKKGDMTSAYGAKETWEQAMNAPGARQLIFLKELMINHHFEELLPGRSLFDDPGERYNYLAALQGKKVLLVYTCNGRSFRLKAVPFNGNKFRFSWFCPRDGMLLKGGRSEKNDLHEFDPPGLPKNGNDWVLILENL